MQSQRRAHRFPLTAGATRGPRNYVACAFYGVILLLLMTVTADMVLCEVEEELKPPENCTSCNDRLRSCGYYGPPNRSCPACGREWSSYRPYYLRWLRDPIRTAFGSIHL